MASEILTFGHSTKTLKDIAELLKPFNVNVIVDVRSQPQSKIAPEFDRRYLESHVSSFGLRYVFMGSALGGRPSMSDHYDSAGRALYYKMAETAEFRRGITSLMAGAQSNRVALMCSEGRFERCHRHLLVGRVLTSRGVLVTHILPDGSLVPQRAEAIQQSLESTEDVTWKSARSVLPENLPRISSKR